MDGWIGDGNMGAAGNGRYQLPDSALFLPSDDYGLFHSALIGKHNHHSPHHQHLGFQLNPNVRNTNGIYGNNNHLPLDYLSSSRIPLNSPFSGIKRYPPLIRSDSSNYRIGVRTLPTPAGQFAVDPLSLRELEEALLETGLINSNMMHRRSQHAGMSVSVEELLLVIKDQQSCRALQQKLEDGKPEEVELIFSEVKNRVPELMIHPSGNYLIQKLFQVCNSHHMTDLLLSTVRDDRQLLAICLDMHGTRAMQTMLQHLTTAEQRALVVSALRRITVTLTKSINGHHVIQHCVKFFSHEEKKPILNLIAENCMDIAMDKSGCCVLQQCVENADGESREPLVAEITANSLVLSEHPYGNYVVQNLLGLRIPHVTSGILKHLRGSIVSLSMNKYGSNVVEKCLKESENDEAITQIIREIIYSPNFLMLLQDQYGNYVVQSALAISKGCNRLEMIALINGHYNYLHSHPYGKRVLAKTRGNK